MCGPISPPARKKPGIAAAALPLVFLLFFPGCGLLTWEYLEIGCCLKENQGYFSEQEIRLDFSHKPDRDHLAQRLQLLAGRQTVSAVSRWEGRTLFLRPEVSWQKGREYTLNLEGSIRMDDGRTYQARFYRRFIYGEEGMDFELLSWTADEDALTFLFGKPVSITSFNDKFSLLPFEERTVDFSPDGKTVTITPKNGWGINRVYTWVIRDVLAADGYIMRKDHTGTFSGGADLAIPELETLCPVSFEPDNVFWHTHSNPDGELREGQVLGFIFSKPMNPDSVKGGVSFYPSLKGHFLVQDERRFLFVPEESYQIDQRYRITLSGTIQDESGIQLHEELRFFFTTANEYLKILNIFFDGNAMTPGDTLRDYLFNPSEKLITTVEFSAEIPGENRKAAADSVSLTALFPATASNPSLLSAGWNPGGSALNLTWQGFTFSTADVDNYYTLKITGGGRGAVNAAGEYLKEDVWVIFRTQK